MILYPTDENDINMQTSDQSAALPLSNKTTIQSGPQHIINSGTRSMETMNANYLSNGSNNGNGNNNANSNGDGHGNGNGHTPLPMGHVLVSDPLAATAPLASDPGSDPSSSQSQSQSQSQHMVHEPTHAHAHASIIVPLQNTSISDSTRSQGCGEPSLVENSTASSATAMSISRHEEWNRNRPTRESVLRRLSDALLRRSLTMIDLSQRGLQPSDARLVKLALLQNSNLSILKLGYNNLSDEGVITLASGISNHAALTSLDLGFNNVGNEGCKALSSAMVSAIRNGGKIHTLYLAGNRITEEGARALSHAFRQDGTTRATRSGSGLTRIHLTGNKLGPEGIRELMDAMTISNESAGLENGIHNDTHNATSDSTCRGVQELFLGETGMGHEGCVAVAKMLGTSTSLRVLSLSNCELDDSSAMLLAAAITSNCKHLPFERLQLSFNNLTCKGIEALMNAVWGLTRLKELQLDNNKMEGRGAQVVSAVLGSVKTLQRLDVGFNAISGTGMKLLMKAVAENSNLTSLTISGNNVDMGSAKAIAYAMAHNASLKAIFLDHCAIDGEGQRHITAGIVSNSRTKLEVLTGFDVGAKVVTLGLPPALERWSNEQVLKFIGFMWNQMRQEQEVNAMDKELDPLHLLPEVNTKPVSGPLDPATVVGVATRAFESLGGARNEILFREGGAQRTASLDSPLTIDAVIMEANGNCIAPNDNFQPTRSQQFLDGHDAYSRPQSPPIPGDLFVTKPHSALVTLTPAAKKKKIVEWLCKSIQHLNELSQLPFNSSELWALHQHFFSPTIQMTVRHCEELSIMGSDVGMKNCNSSSPPGNSILSAPCTTSPSTKPPAIPSSEPVIHGAKSVLKRKVSYRFLGEATMSSSISQPNKKTNKMDQSVSKLIEDMNGQSMQPNLKRPRRNRSRISIVPKIKQKLDSFLDSDHQKALSLMRQLFYVEKSLLNGSIYPIQERGAATHLIGDLAEDAETILLDMM